MRQRSQVSVADDTFSLSINEENRTWTGTPKCLHQSNVRRVRNQRPLHMTTEQPRPADPYRVVIVGAGFGGLEATFGLAGAAVSITLIDRRNHHLFQPLLYQVATASLATSEIAWPIRYLLPAPPALPTSFPTLPRAHADTL